MVDTPTAWNAADQARADTLFLALAGIFACVTGALIFLAGGEIPLLLYAAAILSAVILAKYQVGIWLLVFLLIFASTQLVPRQMFGITGLNPLNALLVVTSLSLFSASLFGRVAIRFVRVPRLLLVYVAAIALAAYIGIGSVDDAIMVPNVDTEPLTATTYLLDNFAKPMIILIVAWLAAVSARNGDGRPLIWALALSYAAFFLIIVGHVVANGIVLEDLASADARGFLNWTGMHANDVGLLGNMGFAFLLFAAAATAEPLPRLILFACAAAAAGMAALTFSRGAFVGLAVIIGYYMLTRRSVGQLLVALSVFIVVALLLPDAFAERATTGFQRADTYAITAGRLDDIWRPLFPTVWDAPIIGHGLSSTLWATPNIRGEMLPVGHPHSAYFAVLLDQGILGVIVVAAFLLSTWRMFRRLSKAPIGARWRGAFEGGVVCLMCLAVQGLTDNHFVPTYQQVPLWLCYGLAVGHAQRMRIAQ